MRFLAISGSARNLSTNTWMLRAVAAVAPPGIEVEVFDAIGTLPVFSPDLEGDATPEPVRAFMRAIAASDGLIVSSPEYVRTIPGGLKNAIDWLVSGEAIVGKPVVLAHASHRGDDMLATLRIVLSTVTQNFNEAIFLRFSVMTQTPDAIAATVAAPENRQRVEDYLLAFAQFCRQCAEDGPPSGDGGTWPVT